MTTPANSTRELRRRDVGVHAPHGRVGVGEEAPGRRRARRHEADHVVHPLARYARLERREEAEPGRVRDGRGGVVGDRGERAAHGERLAARVRQVERDLREERRLDLGRGGRGNEEEEGGNEPFHRRVSTSSSSGRSVRATSAGLPATAVTSRSARARARRGLGDGDAVAPRRHREDERRVGGGRQRDGASARHVDDGDDGGPRDGGDPDLRRRRHMTRRGALHPRTRLRLRPSRQRSPDEEAEERCGGEDDPRRPPRGGRGGSCPPRDELRRCRRHAVGRASPDGIGYESASRSGGVGAPAPRRTETRRSVISR